MIFTTLRQPESWGKLEPAVLEAFEYARSHDLKALPAGSYPIDGERFFVNIVEYETRPAEDRFWEAHKDYLDVHVSLDGLEQIDLGSLDVMTPGEYQKEGDFQPAQGDANCSVLMRPDDVLVCWPNDAHRTAVAPDGHSAPVKKAIFKVRID